ncbi:hypothetical protein FE783_04285 [Paenibacillus mesophilus]|uniref:hypothetical protein n=1 Tax=Paenibacillus mesophilus TaxID=2582849 RepID=UPI00110E5976|nr:hypothetical protein [Paenibacillus mesophilus]TMV52169.1 hypothetical protein FE783_04285 [Paenibacillus mesophilus]
MSYSSIVFKQIRVNEMGSNSGVFIGNNKAPLWGTFSKQQTGIEVANGRAIRNRTFFSDKDVVDIIAVGPLAVKKKRTNKSPKRPRHNGNIRTAKQKAAKRK